MTWIRANSAPIEACNEHAMQVMDRYNRLFLRTLRQLRDLRRYSTPITINNPQQVNSVLSATLILLANSKARQIRTYDGAANGLITRAKAEVLVFSRPTPANQSGP